MIKVKVKLGSGITNILDVVDMKFKFGDRLTLIDMYTSDNSNISLLRLGVKEKKSSEICEELCTKKFIDLELYAQYIEYSVEYYRLQYVSKEEYDRLLKDELERTNLDALMLELAGCTDSEWAEQKMVGNDEEQEPTEDSFKPADGGFEQEV